MGVRRTVGGFAALGAATLFAQVLGFFVLAVIARRLSVADVGAFSFALALAGYFGIAANLGTTTLAVRDLAQRPDDAPVVFGEVLALQAVLGLVPYALLVALAPVLAPDDATRAVIPIVGLGFLVEALSAQWVLLGRQRFGVLAVGRVAGALAFAGLVLLTVREGDDAVALSWIHVGGIVATALIALPWALRSAGRPRLRVRAGVLVRRFRAGVPLGVAAVMTTVYATVDHLMLGWFDDTETVGQYAIAYKLPLAVMAVAALWGGVLLPHMSPLAAGRREELREQLGWFTSLSLAAALPLLAGSVLVGGDLVPELFGERYAPAATPFVVLMACAALVVVTMNVGTAVLALGDERQSAYAVTAGAAVNVVLNLAAIPLLGMTGAALTTLAAEAVVLVWLTRRARLLLGPVPLERDRVARAALATATMCAVLLLASGLPATVRVLLGAAVFALAALPLRVVRPDELRALRPRTGAAA